MEKPDPQTASGKDAMHMTPAHNKTTGLPSEAAITINGHILTSAQSMTVRCAIESLASDLLGGLGDDEHGRAMTAGYMAHIREIRGMMQK